MDEKKKILIVEDDVDLIDMLSNYFRVQGYEIVTASWGEDAVRAAAENVPDLALLDIRLPDIDGFEVCRRLRQNRRTHDLPVIFLTERRERRDRLMGLELGAVDYVTKPFDVQELRLRVRNVLRRANYQTMVNPVTGLPEGSLVREQLERALKSNDWGVVLAGIQGLTHFRDRYGFVASDDVARAVGLMLSQAVQEDEATNNFIGHVDASDFLIITSADRASAIASECKKKLSLSLPYFYPAVDREMMEQRPPQEQLALSVVSLSSESGRFKSYDEVRNALLTT